LFGQITGVAPSAAAGAALWDLIGGDGVAEPAAAAAREGRAFEASACLHRMGASMHLKLSCEPACPAAAAPPAAQPAPAAVQGSGLGGVLPYLVHVDFLGASDAAMWLPCGAPRRFRLLDEDGQ
jgi:hypothetical protein